jgi:hypothetical protein
VIRTGPQPREDDEHFDTIGLMWPVRWENGYAVISPDAKTRSVEVKIEFDPGATVKLAATDPDGRPLAGVTLVGHGPYGRRVPTFPGAVIAVRGLNPKGRPQQLYLLHRERKLCAELLVKGDEPGPVVKLRPCATVSGRVTDHTGKPIPAALVVFQMRDYQADNMIRQKLFRDTSTTTTDADGRFTFERMFPDVEFDLIASLPGFRSGTAALQRVRLKPGEAKDVGELRSRDPKKPDGE